MRLQAGLEKRNRRDRLLGAPAWTQEGRKLSQAFPGAPTPQIFALIIFSSLLTDGYQNQTDSKQLRCVLNSNGAACGFAVGAGVLALLCCLGFLLLDAREASMVSIRFKTAFQLLDFILAGEAEGGRVGHSSTSRLASRTFSPVPRGLPPLLACLLACLLLSTWLAFALWVAPGSALRGIDHSWQDTGYLRGCGDQTLQS